MNSLNTNNNIEALIRKTLQNDEDVEYMPSTVDRPCLSNEEIQGLYLATLPDRKQQEIYRHLGNCHSCRVDLEFYHEIMKE